MTISSQTSKVSYTGDGSTTVLPYTFKILSQTELLVQKQNTTTGVITNLTITTDYTVSGVGLNAGGNVTLVAASESGYKYIIKRSMSKTQPADFNEYDTFPAETLESSLDRLTMIAQELVEVDTRTPKIDSAVTGFSTDLPNPTLYAGYLVRINVAGTAWEYITPTSIGAYSFPAGTGLLVQTAAATAIARTITGTANEITATNGNGVSGNPTLSLPSALTFTSKTVTGGTFASITLSGTIDGTPSYSGTQAFSTGTFSSYLNEAKGSDIASASTTDIGAATGNYVKITGTTTITALGTVQAGTRRIVEFTGALTLTHNATSLILPTGGNIVTVAGDVATFVSLGSGNWKCTSYTGRDNTIILTDVTTNDVSTSKHGFIPKVPATNTVWLGSGSGSYGQVPLTTHVSGTLPVANGGSGVTSSNPVIQRVSTETGAVGTATTTMPIDDTIPQNTEGDQYMQLAITPKSSSNILVIDVVWIGANSAASGYFGVALFQDATANALAAAVDVVNNANTRTIKFRHIMTAGTTSSTTFKVRAGNSAAGTTTFNGAASGRFLGGVMASSIQITEYAS